MNIRILIRRLVGVLALWCYPLAVLFDWLWSSNDDDTNHWRVAWLSWRQTFWDAP